MSALGSNVLGNILATIILLISGWILSIILRLPFVSRKRRRLFQFFGITKDHPKFIVYLSTVDVQHGGSVDFRGIPRTFAGPAVPAAELSIIEPVARLFSDPLLDSLPLPIREWLGNKVHWSFLPISPVFVASPQDRNQVEQGNILTVGSQYYNTAADLYTETCAPILKMEQVDRRMIIRVSQGPRRDDIFQPRPGQADDLAIVEKLYDSATSSTVFMAAGLGVVGTKGAVHFIVENWAKLQHDFGTRPFAICLRFQNIETDPNAFKKPIELSRFESGPMAYNIPSTSVGFPATGSGESPHALKGILDLSSRRSFSATGTYIEEEFPYDVDDSSPHLPFLEERVDQLPGLKRLHALHPDAEGWRKAARQSLSQALGEDSYLVREWDKIPWRTSEDPEDADEQHIMYLRSLDEAEGILKAAIKILRNRVT